MSSYQITFFIADDHQILSESLQKSLTAEGFSFVGSCTNGNDAVNEIIQLRPDVILMDIDLYGINGLEATSRILEKFEEAKIIILSMHLEKSLIEKAIKIGVKGYLPKNASVEELVKAIEEVYEGKRYFSADATTSLAMGEHSSSVMSHHPDLLKMAASLTKREIEIVKEISNGKTNKEIGETLHVSVHTVDSHRKNIMQKIGVNNTAGLIRFALKSGLCD